MAFFCVRIDLDYVPWDSPDAFEFGHGEPATTMRLLELARSTGNRFQFYASNRALRAFPAIAESVLNEGHDLDWFSKHPEENLGRYEESVRLFETMGHHALGLAVRAAIPDGAIIPNGIRFISANGGQFPGAIRSFLIEGKSDRDAARNGIGVRAWTDSIKAQIRDAASRNREYTVSFRPQVLAKYDPKLNHVKELVELARAVGLPVLSHRQAFDREATSA